MTVRIRDGSKRYIPGGAVVVFGDNKVTGLRAGWWERKGECLFETYAPCCKSNRKRCRRPESRRVR